MDQKESSKGWMRVAIDFFAESIVFVPFRTRFCVCFYFSSIDFLFEGAPVPISVVTDQIP